MTDQMVFPELNRTTSSKIFVKATSHTLGQRVHSMVSEQTILVEVRKARKELQNGPSDRLAELREAAARRMREMPDYPDPVAEAQERALVVEAFEPLQTETAAWNAGD